MDLNGFVYTESDTEHEILDFKSDAIIGVRLWNPWMEVSMFCILIWIFCVTRGGLWYIVWWLHYAYPFAKWFCWSFHLERVYFSIPLKLGQTYGERNVMEVTIFVFLSIDLRRDCSYCLHSLRTLKLSGLRKSPNERQSSWKKPAIPAVPDEPTPRLIHWLNTETERAQGKPARSNQHTESWEMINHYVLK